MVACDVHDNLASQAAELSLLPQLCELEPETLRLQPMSAISEFKT